MTTVIYDHKRKQVAIDSRYTRGDVIDTDKGNKVRKDSRGIWLFSGHQADFEDLMALKRNEKVEVRPECGAILIKNGCAFVVDTDEDGFCIVAKLNDSFAMGSGYKFAIAALDLGKTAKEAVNYAKTRDIYTGGRVRVFDVK